MISYKIHVLCAVALPMAYNQINWPTTIFSNGNCTCFGRNMCSALVTSKKIEKSSHSFLFEVCNVAKTMP
jgi:hypothetical protein